MPSTFFAMSAVEGDYPKVTIGTLGHQEFAWGRIEQSRGNFNFQLFDDYLDVAQQHGLVDPVTNVANFAMTLAAGTPGWAVGDHSTCSGTAIVLCTAPPDNIQDWTDFVTALLQHYDGKTKPHIRYYELWNEFNVSLWWTGGDAKMLELAQAAYPIIHQDPYSILLTPSVAGPVGTASPHSGVTWMTSYLQAGGWQYADGGAFHGYIAAQSGVNPFPMPEDDSTADCKPFVTCYGSIVTKAMQIRGLRPERAGGQADVSDRRKLGQQHRDRPGHASGVAGSIYPAASRAALHTESTAGSLVHLGGSFGPD